MRESQLTSVVLATYNERENILLMIDEILRYVKPPVEIIVVDDNSPDGTWQLAENCGRPEVRVIKRIHERGLASAFYRGIQESQGNIIIWMDSDLCMPPRLLPDMITKLSDTDIVIGSRYVKGGKDDRSWLRVSSSWFINKLAQIVLNPAVHDQDSGFAVVKREVITKTPIIPVGYGEYFMEFLYAASKRGFHIYEFPYLFKDRERGGSKSAPNFFHFAKTGFQYIVRIFQARLRN